MREGFGPNFSNNSHKWIITILCWKSRVFHGSVTYCSSRRRRSRRSWPELCLSQQSVTELIKCLPFADLMIPSFYRFSFVVSVVVKIVDILMWTLMTIGQRILTKGHIACCAIMEDWMILLRSTSQQGLPVLFIGLDNPKNCSFPSRPPSNRWFLGPTRVSHPNSISIG